MEQYPQRSTISVWMEVPGGSGISRLEHFFQMGEGELTGLLNKGILHVWKTWNIASFLRQLRRFLQARNYCVRSGKETVTSKSACKMAVSWRHHLCGVDISLVKLLLGSPGFWKYLSYILVSSPSKLIGLLRQSLKKKILTLACCHFSVWAK